MGVMGLSAYSSQSADSQMAEIFGIHTYLEIIIVSTVVKTLGHASQTPIQRNTSSSIGLALSGCHENQGLKSRYILQSSISIESQNTEFPEKLNEFWFRPRLAASDLYVSF